MAKSKPATGFGTAQQPQIKALLSNAVKFMQSGMAGQAKAQCQQVLQRAPQNADAHYMLGLIAVRAGHLEDAVKHLSEALRLAPANPAGHNNLGVVQKRLGLLDQARASFEAAIALNSDYAEALANLGNVLQMLGQPELALTTLDRAVALRPDLAEAHNNRGQLLLQLQRPAEALASLDQALALRPDYAAALNNKSNLLLMSGRAAEAVAHARRAIALNPGLADAHYNLGLGLLRQRRLDDAVASFNAAIQLDPSHAMAYAGRGGLWVEAHRYEQAMLDLDRAISLDPSYAEAYENRALAAAGAKRYAEVIRSYQQLSQLDPDHLYLKGNLLHAKMLCCDWDGVNALTRELATEVAAGRPSAEPFGYQGIADSEAFLLACARTYAQREYPAPPIAATVPAIARKEGKITIGYLCGEFRQHATTILMCGVFEHHDKQRFTLLAFDSGTADDSDYRRRVQAAFDEVIDISRLSDEEAAALVASHQVDVLVDLNGYYGAERTGLLALRPSPVQVNYLGFPGTLGASYVDYLVADEVVIPPSSRQFYVEQVVYLPHCYQANDGRRAIAQTSYERSEFGLPEAAFVYCCFNNNYKLTPAQFASWMRILRRVEGSCLWLLEDHTDVSERLRRVAADEGVDPGRLVFAKRLPPAEHLARHRLADLFLDTLPYNAHTTASDALWAGLPVLTRTGTTFAGRVGTSLLQAVGLPELIATSEPGYEDLAVALAHDRSRLAALQARLAAHRLQEPLFNTAMLTRHLEAAYEEMVECCERGQSPRHFRVSPSRGSGRTPP